MRPTLVWDIVDIMKVKYQSCRFSRSESVAHRRVVDEVMLLPIRTDASEKQAVYSLNPTAAMIWEMIDGEAGFDDLVAGVVSAYEVSEELAREDVRVLLDDLVSIIPQVAYDHPPPRFPWRGFDKLRLQRNLVNKERLGSRMKALLPDERCGVRSYQIPYLGKNSLLL